jgi:uncharacterized protein (UPF0332 family)
MSQASNKLKWCLNKAKKELEETGLHRGLVKGGADQKLAEKHIAKAEHNLNAAFYFDEGGYSDWSTSALFYCMYHCFLAILRKHGYESRNQECTLAVIESLMEDGTIILDTKFLNALKITKIKEADHSAIKIREDFQYGVELAFERRDEFDAFVEMCKEIINATKNIVYEK